MAAFWVAQVLLVVAQTPTLIDSQELQVGGQWASGGQPVPKLLRTPARCRENMTLNHRSVPPRLSRHREVRTDSSPTSKYMNMGKLVTEHEG